MQGIYLKFYVHENRNHHHTLVYEWLLEQAKKLGIHGVGIQSHRRFRTPRCAA